nr:MAG TPA: DNA repair protein-like protein [Caudoviricetes sp.]
MELQAIEKTLYNLLPAQSVREMVEQYNGDPFSALFTADESEWLAVKGFGAVGLRKLQALKNIINGYQEKRTWEMVDASSPESVYNALQGMQYLQCEQFKAVFLNVKNKIIKIVTLSSGGLTSSTAEQRALFREAIKANAAGIILAHNHPSGDPTESTDDVRVTKIMVRAGEIMGIPVLDHVIIGKGVYVSMMEKGII